VRAVVERRKRGNRDRIHPIHLLKLVEERELEVV